MSARAPQIRLRFAGRAPQPWPPPGPGRRPVGSAVSRAGPWPRRRRGARPRPRIAAAGRARVVAGHQATAGVHHPPPGQGPVAGGQQVAHGPGRARDSRPRAPPRRRSSPRRRGMARITAVTAASSNCPAPRCPEPSLTWHRCRSRRPTGRVASGPTGPSPALSRAERRQWSWSSMTMVALGAGSSPSASIDGRVVVGPPVAHRGHAHGPGAGHVGAAQVAHVRGARRVDPAQAGQGVLEDLAVPACTSPPRRRTTSGRTARARRGRPGSPAAPCDGVRPTSQMMPSRSPRSCSATSVSATWSVRRMSQVGGARGVGHDHHLAPASLVQVELEQRRPPARRHGGR